MTLLYNKIQKSNPQDPEGPRKWYPVLKTTGQVSQQEVGKLVSDETTINAKEAELGIYQYAKVVMRLLLDAKTVPFGDAGYFYLTATSEGSDTEKEVTADNFRDITIRFRASNDMRHELSHATFAYVKSLLPEYRKGTGEGASTQS